MSGILTAWTAAEDNMLRAEWKQGLSCSQIATQLNARFGNGRSRNAVIGRRHRLGLPKRDTVTGMVRNPRKVRRKALPPMAEPVTETPRSEPETGRQRATATPATPPEPKPEKRAPRPSESAEPSEPMRRVEIRELARNECRWPVNDAADGEEHLFCGRKQVEGSSYCAAHRARSISPKSEATLKVPPVSMKVAMS